MRQLVPALTYSPLLWEHYQTPYHRERPELFLASARRINPVCPDALEFFLQLTPQGQVEGLYFWAEACAPTVATASLICQWSEGRPLQELSQLDLDWCMRQLGALPRHKTHAIHLVCDCLKEVLNRVSFNQNAEGV